MKEPHWLLACPPPDEKLSVFSSDVLKYKARYSVTRFIRFLGLQKSKFSHYKRFSGAAALSVFVLL